MSTTIENEGEPVDTAPNRARKRTLREHAARVRAIGAAGIPTIGTTWKRITATVVGLVGLAIFIMVVGSVVGDVVQKPIVLEEIAVPQSMNLAGYSPTVTAAEMQDAIAGIVEKAQTHMTAPQFAMAATRVDITVPTVGLSLSSFSKALVRFFHLSGARYITGEITRRENNKLFITLRMNNVAFFTSSAGSADAQHAIVEGATAIVDLTAPYYVAATLPDTDAERRAEDIIRRLPPADVNVYFAHTLRAQSYANRLRYAEAERDLREAVAQHPDLAFAHMLLGEVLAAEGRGRDAMAEDVIAEHASPKMSTPYLDQGRLFEVRKDYADATAAYDTGLSLHDDAAEHNDADLHLGLVRSFTAWPGHDADADRSWRAAIAAQPENALLHEHYAYFLLTRSKPDLRAALEEYRQTTLHDPRAHEAFRNAAYIEIRMFSSPATSDAEAETDVRKGCAYLATAHRIDPTETALDRQYEAAVRRGENGKSCAQLLHR